MLAVGHAVIFCYDVCVVPRITENFADMKQTLPWMTIVLIAVSHFLKSFWWLFLLAAAA
jgi:general secretion pathway protein F